MQSFCIADAPTSLARKKDEDVFSIDRKSLNDAVKSTDDTTNTNWK